MLTNRQNLPQRPANSTTSTGPAQFHPLSIARMFWKHKLQIALVWMVLSVIAIGIVYRLPAVYKAEAVVLVDSQRIPDKYVMPTVNTALEDRLLTLRKEVLAYDSLQAIIEQHKLYREEQKSESQEEILETMLKDTQVELEKGWTRDRPGAFKVTYQGGDPRVVAEVTHDIAMRFVDKNLETREKRASQTKEFLTTQLEQAAKDLQTQEKKVSDFKSQYNGELPEQENSLGTILSRLQLELQGNQDTINRTQQEKLMLENSIGVAESSLASMTSMAEQAAAAGRTNSPDGTPAPRQPKESEVLQARLDALLVRYSEEYPEVKRLRAEIAERREAESRAETSSAKAPQTANPAGTNGPLKVSPEMADKLMKERERLASLKSSLALANRDLELRNTEHQKILKNIEVYEGRLSRLPLREQQMTGLTRDYEVSKEHYKRLEDNKISADMASDMEKEQQAEKLTLLQDARIPEVPFKPVRALWISVGCVGALLISLVIGAFRELRKGAFLGEWELPAEVTVLGRVPRIALEGSGLDGSPGSGSWLQRRWRHALVLSVVVTLVCGIAAVVFRGLKF